jgi:Domain of Unknown Function (DUF1080)
MRSPTHHRKLAACTSAFAMGLLLLCIPSTRLKADDPAPKLEAKTLVGRWDLTVTGADGVKYPSWFEVQRSGLTALVGSYVGRFGSARPISKVEINKDSFHFTVPPQWEFRASDITLEGKLDGEVLRGETTDEKGKKITWEGRRAPSLKRTQPPKWGEPIELFNGKDLTGWKPRSASVKNGWQAKEGLLANVTSGNDLLTERLFTDFKLHAEFRYPKGSNSGVYLRGRYEVQIEDNFGSEPDSHKIGGVYGFLTPCVNAAKKAGEWQTLEVTLVGREVTIVLNGERVIDRQTIPGITGGALDSDEGKPGPIMLQGDHGPIDFRNLTLVPAEPADGGLDKK